MLHVDDIGGGARVQRYFSGKGFRRFRKDNGDVVYISTCSPYGVVELVGCGFLDTETLFLEELSCEQKFLLVEKFDKNIIYARRARIF